MWSSAGLRASRMSCLLFRWAVTVCRAGERRLRYPLPLPPSPSPSCPSIYTNDAQPPLPFLLSPPLLPSTQHLAHTRAQKDDYSTLGLNLVWSAGMLMGDGREDGHGHVMAACIEGCFARSRLLTSLPTSSSLRLVGFVLVLESALRVGAGCHPGTGRPQQEQRVGGPARPGSCRGC